MFENVLTVGNYVLILFILIAVGFVCNKLKLISRTTVKDGAFIGCNTNLVAPVTIGENAFTAAGSTITENVPDNALSVARAKQTNKENWVNIKKPYKRQHQELK